VLINCEHEVNEREIEFFSPGNMSLDCCLESFPSCSFY
jgi:hypothetical protein